MSSLLKDRKEKNTFEQNAQSSVLEVNSSLTQSFQSPETSQALQSSQSLQSPQSPLSQKLAQVTHDFAEEVRALPAQQEQAYDLDSLVNSEQGTNNLASEEDASFSTHQGHNELQSHNEKLNRQGLDNRSAAKHLPFNLDKRNMQNTLAQHASTQVFLQNTLQKHEAKNMLANVPAYSKKSSIAVYKKQLVETRTLIYYQQHLRMLSDKEKKDPEAKRRFVIKRVARELWTNFCVRGQETPMLQYLHEALRKEYNEDLKFYYKPGSIELIIMHPVVNTQEKQTTANASTQNTSKKVSKEEAMKLAMASQEAMKEKLAQQKIAKQEKELRQDQEKQTLALQETTQKTAQEMSQNMSQNMSQDINAGRIQATGENFAKHTDFNMLDYEPVSRQVQVEMVNKAWQLSQEIVASHATE